MYVQFVRHCLNWCDHHFPSFSPPTASQQKPPLGIFNLSSSTCPCFSQKLEGAAPCGPSSPSSYRYLKLRPCQLDRLSPPWHRSAPKKQDVGKGNWEPCRFCTLTNQPGSVGCISRPVHPLATHVSAHSCFTFCSLHQKLLRGRSLPTALPKDDEDPMISLW